MASGDRGPQVEAVAIVFLILSWVIVCLRCYVRIFVTSLFRIDDWLAAITLVAFTFFCTFVLVGAIWGTGQIPSLLTPQDREIAMMWWYCGEITYGITTCLMKVSVGAFLLQICVNKVQRTIIWTVMIGFSIFTAYYVPLMVFQCHPISFFWTNSGEGGCLPSDLIRNSTYAHGALSTVVDFTLGTVPIFVVSRLQMNRRTKISAALLLALGSIGSMATAIRIQYISQLEPGADFLYNNTGLSIWSTIEAGIGITASSMACLRPLFQAFFLRSRATGSNIQVTTFRNATRATAAPGNNNGQEQIKLHNSFARNILVTTVIDSRSARESRDVEMGGDFGLERSDSARGLTRATAWSTQKKSSVDDGSDDNGYGSNYGGVEIACRAVPT